MKRIFIVEDEIIVAKDLEYMLSAKEFEVIGIATSYESAKQKLLMSKPDLILCDINLKGKKTGIDLMQEVQNKYNIPFIFITAYSDMDTIERANKLNPINYITKPFNEKQLISSIRIALIEEVDSDKPTSREQVVLNLIAKGRNSKQIADELNISFNTVETHRKNLLRKYNVKTAAELVCLATSKGWIIFNKQIILKTNLILPL